MKTKTKQSKGHLLRSLLITSAVLAALIIVCAVYLGTYYHADTSAEACLASPAAGITITQGSDDALIFEPEQPDAIQAGLIFYPGGKVACEAYAPLMSRLAGGGILCVLIKMPGNLAILDIHAADGICEQFPEVKEWYIGGHSLGGLAAAMYLEEHTEEYTGLLLLGAYSTADFSSSNLSVLSVYGENDGVMNRANYEKNLINMPADFTEFIIPGGCHAGFGCYGPQNGDGPPTITADEQQFETAEAVFNWMGIM